MSSAWRIVAEAHTHAATGEGEAEAGPVFRRVGGGAELTAAGRRLLGRYGQPPDPTVRPEDLGAVSNDDAGSWGFRCTLMALKREMPDLVADDDEPGLFNVAESADEDWQLARLKLGIAGLPGALVSIDVTRESPALGELLAATERLKTSVVAGPRGGYTLRVYPD